VDAAVLPVAAPVERVVDEAETVPGAVLPECFDVGGDRSAVELVLQEQDDVKVIRPSALPLCNTGERTYP
jgi:hypothetical protein